MKPMDDTAQSTSGNQIFSQQQGGSVGFAKETETTPIHPQPEISSLTEIGREIELPPEVSSVGVSVHPTVINIPPPLEAHVTQVGHNTVLGTGESITLPLTDDQILAGLKQPPTSSWKFLSLWCKRKLQQIGRVIRTIGGKTVEVNI
jgi:hypothetical protein